jgi:hypothetical protein
MNPPWSEAETAMLGDLAAAGLSAAAIAARLAAATGVVRSRNSIIGKITRAGGRLGRLEGPPVKPRREPRQPTVRRPRAVARSRPRPTGAEASPETQPASLPATLPATVPMPFLAAVEGNRCLHFAGEPFGPSGPDMPVCGARRAADAGPDNRYCAFHRAAVAEARP